MPYIKFPVVTGNAPFSLGQTRQPIWGCDKCSFVIYTDDLGALQLHEIDKHPRKKKEKKEKKYKPQKEKLRAPDANERKQLRAIIAESHSLFRK